MHAPAEHRDPAAERPTGMDIAGRLAGMVAVLVLAALNRKLNWALLDRPVLDSLLLRDALVMLLFTPLVLLQSLDLFRRLRGFRSPALTALFVLGGYLLGAGFGMHEPFNRLSATLAGRIPPELAGPMVYFDDGLGHWLFFAGFACVVLAGVGAELMAKIRQSRAASGCAIAAGTLLATIVYLNMWRERTTVDLAVMASVCTVTAVLHVRLEPREYPPPLTLAVYLGFGGGTLATLAAGLLRAMGG